MWKSRVKQKEYQYKASYGGPIFDVKVIGTADSNIPFFFSFSTLKSWHCLFSHYTYPFSSIMNRILIHYYSYYTYPFLFFLYLSIFILIMFDVSSKFRCYIFVSHGTSLQIDYVLQISIYPLICGEYLISVTCWYTEF